LPGYGDVYPVTQAGRLLFGFYIPVSVTIVIGCIGNFVKLIHEFDTIIVVQREPLGKMFEIDKQSYADGNGSVSMAEYVLFMLVSGPASGLLIHVLGPGEIGSFWESIHPDCP
jgi:hypothetical protein